MATCLIRAWSGSYVRCRLVERSARERNVVAFALDVELEIQLDVLGTSDVIDVLGVFGAAQPHHSRGGTRRAPNLLTRLGARRE